MSLQNDYLYRALISAKRTFENIQQSYFSDSRIINLVKEIIDLLSACIDNYNTQKESEYYANLHLINAIEEYIVNSVPKNYPNELKYLLNIIWKKKIKNEELNFLITQQPNLSYHHFPVYSPKHNHVFLCIPKHYKNEILLNSVLLHELGHYFDDLYEDRPLIKTENTPPDDYFKNNYKKKFKDKSDDNMIEINAVSWMKEFFADSFFVYLGNITAFFVS